MCDYKEKPENASPSSGDGCASLSKCEKQCWRCHAITTPVQNGDITTERCACGAQREPFSPGIKPPDNYIFCKKCREYVRVTADDELRYDPCHKCGFKVHAFGKGKDVDDPDDPDEGWMIVE